MRGTGNKFGTKRDKAEFLAKTQRVPEYPSTHSSGATGATPLPSKVGAYLPTNSRKDKGRNINE